MSRDHLISSLSFRCPNIGPKYWPWLPAYWGQVMPYISHTLMMLNSSGNFAIYCLVGHTFRRELLRTFGFALVLYRFLKLTSYN